MCQSRSLSAIEPASNLVMGYGLAMILQLAVFAVMGLAVTPVQSLHLGGVFTLLSFARSHALHRLIERIGHGGRK
ncbi:hypothetical protein DEA8626_04060 [Defluviimonas aquaemixtae]|uniref:Uncharacterized protein n=1 Tax=Albidovulum aquaemixtae TaxID=1542388 RepID=A0A2R8BNV9_9RHOB|nr:hypothetical protein [Defluviimonas aquaemixtae]SPH25025.1 hypothetical protein DEA8626_04060 [Defluviimonas aquaemixtae]